MTHRKSFAGRLRIVACIIEEKSVQLILFPHLPIRRLEVRHLEGFAAGDLPRPWAHVATDRAIPAVGSHFHVARQPHRLELAAVAGGDIFWTPQNRVAAKERTQLAYLEESHLIAELRGIDVPTRGTGHVSGPARETTVVWPGIGPAVRAVVGRAVHRAPGRRPTKQ